MSIDDEHLTRLSSVVQELQERGLEVEQVLDGVGLVTGTVTDEHRGGLALVPGVASVDGALTFQLPSPDSAVQ